MNQSKKHIFSLVWLLMISFSVASNISVASDRLDGVGVTEKLGNYISMDTRFFNEHGEEVEIGSLLNNGRPAVLALVYYECPLLCNLILNGLATAVSQLQWTPGNQYDIITVSISAKETPEMAREKKQAYIHSLGRPEIEQGWHFLTGTEDQIRKLADEVGYGFTWDEETQEYFHGSTLIFLSSSGMVSRYLHGIDYPEFDMRNALFDAANGRIGNTIERMVLFCFQYDANSGSYIPVAINIMKLGGAFTLLVLGLFLGILWFRDFRDKRLLQTT